jgi:hypothetical protein
MAPPWYLDQARDDGEAIEGCWAEIAGDHREAFDLLSNDDRDPDFATSLALTVSADERLYDTTQDCIATFEDYAELKEPVDYESRLCLDYGLEYLCDESGFQVDTWLLWELLEDAGQNAPDFYPGTWNTELDRYEHIGRSGCFDVIETDAYDKMSGEPIVQHLPAGASGLFTQDDGVRDAISREPLLW